MTQVKESWQADNNMTKCDISSECSIFIVYSRNYSEQIILGKHKTQISLISNTLNIVQFLY